MTQLTLSQIQAEKRTLAIRRKSIDWDMAILRRERQDIETALQHLETAEIKLHIETHGISYIFGPKPPKPEPNPKPPKRPSDPETPARLLKSMSKEELRNLLKAQGVI